MVTSARVGFHALRTVLILALITPAINAQITCSEVIAAIDADDLNIEVSECILDSFDPSRTITIQNQLGAILPVRGSSFLALSTGDITLPPEPGTIISPAGGDTTGVILPWRDLPTGPVVISFRYRVLTAEYPETLNTGDGDAIVLRVIASGSSPSCVESRLPGVGAQLGSGYCSRHS